MTSTQEPIRVTIVQPSLAKYRVPVFRELASRPGIDLQVIYGTFPGIPNAVPDGFKATHIPIQVKTILGKPVYIHAAQWNYATKKETDVLLLTWTPRYIFLPWVLKHAKRSGVDTVLWGHGYSKAPNPIRTFFRERIAKQATAILFYSESVRSNFIERGWSSENLFVAPNSIDSAPIQSSQQWWKEHPEELVKFKEENDLTDRPILLYVSRLEQANRVDYLIDSTAKLLSDFPTLKTVIIGNGDEARAQLRQLVRDHGIEDSVVLLNGIYDERALAAWFLSAQVYCYPENIGLSLLHAFWYGLPVVTSDKTSAQNPEIVAMETGVNGLTYEDGNNNAMTSAIGQMLVDQGFRKRLSLQARKTVEERFTIQKMVDGIESAIRFANHRSQHL